MSFAQVQWFAQARRDAERRITLGDSPEARKPWIERRDDLVAWEKEVGCHHLVNIELIRLQQKDRAE